MSPSDPRLRFGFQFVTVSRLWRRILDQRMSASGWTDISWAPLIHLDESGDGISQKALAALVGMDGSTLVRLLDKLEEKGQIERRADAEDRRTKKVFLTESGRQEVAAIRSELHAIEAEILVDVSDRQITSMLTALTRIQDRLNEAGKSRDAGL